MDSKLKSHNFAEYFKHYTSLVDTSIEIDEILNQVHKETTELFDLVTEDQGDYTYEPGKWSIKELLLHLIDTERIFCNRALRFARKDQTDLPGFDHDTFVTHSNANDRNLADILGEFNLVRAATIALFQSFSKDMLEQKGTANGNPLTVMAIGYIIAGHERHHVNILKERYL